MPTTHQNPAAKERFWNAERVGAAGLAIAALGYIAIDVRGSTGVQTIREAYSGEKGCLNTPYTEASGAKTLANVSTDGNEQVIVAPSPTANSAPDLVFNIDRSLLGSVSVEPTQDTEALLPATC